MIFIRGLCGINQTNHLEARDLQKALYCFVDYVEIKATS